MATWLTHVLQEIEAAKEEEAKKELRKKAKAYGELVSALQEILPTEEYNDIMHGELNNSLDPAPSIRSGEWEFYRNVEACGTGFYIRKIGYSEVWSKPWISNYADLVQACQSLLEQADRQDHEKRRAEERKAEIERQRSEAQREVHEELSWQDLEVVAECEALARAINAHETLSKYQWALRSAILAFTSAQDLAEMMIASATGQPDEDNDQQ